MRDAHEQTTCETCGGAEGAMTWCQDTLFCASCWKDFGTNRWKGIGSLIGKPRVDGVVQENVENPIIEMWHVMFFIRGDIAGWYQFFHPSEAAARAEEKRLNEDVDLIAMGGKAEAFRYVLAPTDAEAIDEDAGRCGLCGKPCELVRPGKSQLTCACDDTEPVI